MSVFCRLRRLLPILLVSLLLVACGLRPTAPVATRVLFVGNSLTYYGNLPAVFAALARANGHGADGFMIVSPGGTLAERAADDSVAPGLRQCQCNVLVLQERGGDLVGSFGTAAQARSRQAIARLADIGRAHGARVMLLGSYNSRSVAARLERDEADAARAAGVPYIAVARRLWAGHDSAPSLAWLRQQDGGHPGAALTLLDAMLVYAQVYHDKPHAAALEVDAPIYGKDSGLTPTLRAAAAPPPNPSSTSRGTTYALATVASLLRGLAAPATGD